MGSASAGGICSTTINDERRAEFFALLERACRVGSLIPDVDDIDLDDPVALAELKLILAEFNAVLSAIEAFPPARVALSTNLI